MATREGVPALCRALGMPEPQSFAAACRSLHYADDPAASSPPEFSASDVRFYYDDNDRVGTPFVFVV